MEKPSRKIAIIGAGPGGLAAAYDLTRAGHAVTIFEAAPEVGGLAAGFKAPHWQWTLEKYYHHWFASDKAILGLIDELGWSDQVLFPRPYTVIYWEGKFYPFDDIFSNIPLFLLRHFPIWDVIRYGLAGAYLRFSPWWQPLEKVTAVEWTKRWFGQHVFATQWKPLLVSKFGEENYPTVNMAWLWARLHARTTRLGTFAGGFQAFLDKLAEVVKKQGAEIKLNAPVTGIKRKKAQGTGKKDHGENPKSQIPNSTIQNRKSKIENQKWVVECNAEVFEGFDAVLSTSSPALMARMAPDLPAGYAGQLQALKSMGAVVLVLALDRQLTKFYWHNLPKEAGFPFLALVEHTNYMQPENYGGDHIIYCGDYLDQGHEYFKLSKEELLEKFLPALKRFNPDFDRSWVKQTWLWKTNYAQPVPPLNHSRNIPAIRTPLKGLYFASMSQVYPWDRGTNFAVEIGRKAAKMVMENTGMG